MNTEINLGHQEKKNGTRNQSYKKKKRISEHELVIGTLDVFLLVGNTNF